MIETLFAMFGPVRSDASPTDIRCVLHAGCFTAAACWRIWISVGTALPIWRVTGRLIGLRRVCNHVCGTKFYSSGMEIFQLYPLSFDFCMKYHYSTGDRQFVTLSIMGLLLSHQSHIFFQSFSTSFPPNSIMVNVVHKLCEYVLPTMAWFKHNQILRSITDMVLWANIYLPYPNRLWLVIIKWSKDGFVLKEGFS